MNITLNQDGTLTIPGGFTVVEPAFILKALDGTLFTMTQITLLQAQVDVLQTQVATLQDKIAAAQKVLA